MEYWVYVLANPEGRIYIGQTDDLYRRLAQHNDVDFRGTLHTKRHPGPWRLLHQESFPTRRAVRASRARVKECQRTRVDQVHLPEWLLIRQPADSREQPPENAG